jgi:hypothetical protein
MSIESQPMFQRNMWPPFSRLKSKQALLAAFFMLVSWLAYSPPLNMMASCSSKTLVNFQKTTQHYIPENRILNTLCLNIHATDASNLQSVFYIYLLFLQTMHLILSFCIYEYNEKRKFLKNEMKSEWQVKIFIWIQFLW